MKHRHGEVRIIAGQWRGRRISFPEREGLRPTTDRTRETLFNWLAPHIVDSLCLDVFAGSGALSFEAASRGARKVTMLEKSHECAQSLKHTAQVLDTNQVSIRQHAFPKPFHSTEPYDIVFFDPPFSSEYLKQAERWLLDNQLLKPEALVYVEFSKRDVASISFEHLQLYKQSTSKHVCYQLLRY